MATEPELERDEDCVIYQWPIPRTCFVCPHHQDQPDGSGVGLRSWCHMWDAEIDSEVVEAENCSLFEIDPEKVQR